MSSLSTPALHTMSTDTSFTSFATDEVDVTPVHTIDLGSSVMTVFTDADATPQTVQAFDRLRSCGAIIRSNLIKHNTAWHDLFLQWWSETTYFKQFHDTSPDPTSLIKQRKLPWMIQNTRSRVWEFFVEVADRKTGTPHILCTICTTLLHHPRRLKSTNIDGVSGGISHLRLHLQSRRCKASRDTEGLIQIDLKAIGDPARRVC
jgi:hypothetical protein